MTKSYPKKRISSRQPLILMCLCFAAGYLTASLFGLDHLGQLLYRQVIPGKMQKSISGAEAERTLPKPQFEFYSDLTQQQIQTPVKVEQVKPSPQVVVKQKVSYLLQVASFKSIHEADRLKAKLTLQGFQVSLEMVKNGDKSWHRVMVGPFAKKMDAEKAQTSIAHSEHTLGMIKKHAVG